MSKSLKYYTDALLPEPYRILGVKLRPFSLGHYFLMKKFDVDPENMGGIEDLLMAIAICGRTYEEFVDFIGNPKDFNLWGRKWGKKIKHQIYKDKFIQYIPHRFRKNWVPFNFLHKVQAFLCYMKDGIKVPKVWDADNNDSGTSGAHWTQSVLSTLISELNYTESQALNMPLSKAIADYYKWAEKQGMVELLNDDELEMVEPDGK